MIDPMPARRSSTLGMRPIFSLLQRATANPVSLRGLHPRRQTLLYLQTLPATFNRKLCQSHWVSLGGGFGKGIIRSSCSTPEDFVAVVEHLKGAGRLQVVADDVADPPEANAPLHTLCLDVRHRRQIQLRKHMNVWTAVKAN